MLGISPSETHSLDESKLRRIFHHRSRLLHPDLNPTGEGVDASEFEGGIVPTIYEVNQAYEAVKTVLDLKGLEA